MPTFSLLKRGSRGSRGPDDEKNQQPTSTSILSSPMMSPNRGVSTEDRDRKGSKRERIQNLLSRTPLKPRASMSGAGSVRSKAQSLRSGEIAQKAPISPRSPLINANKPLPSPPPPDREETKPRPPRPVLKLNRIMATLSDEDIEKLFSGAPQYFARQEGHNTGAPHPSVAFPWDEELQIRDLTDHTQIENHAWSSVTAWPHITRHVRRDGEVPPPTAEPKKPHFYPRCRERPNMLSMQGLEKGTMGYQAILELAVADALQEEQFGFDSIGSKATAVTEQRQRLLSSQDALRPLGEEAILNQLIKNSSRYRANSLDTRDTATLYNELFTNVLHPPSRVIDHRDPYSLTVQIYAILKVLITPNAWIDFSHVEWRIRLGQILWGTAEGDDIRDGASIHDANSVKQRRTERYWLLLQILLACELLLRLDAITAGEELGVESINPLEIRRFEKEANASVKWSLVLARTWLENIDLSREEISEPNPTTQAPQTEGHVGWLAALTSKMTLIRHSKPAPVEPDLVQFSYTALGRHHQKQIDGLSHFARKLRWPDIEVYEARIRESLNSVDGLHSGNVTPSGEMSRISRRHSLHFGPADEKAVAEHSKPVRRPKVRAALHPSGWLSKSYISGLVLPGEALGHFLMASLLESDGLALQRLGSMANFGGGFVYGGKSFWSTACIVGRVLAAGKGSAECMGWISSDVTPRSLSEGWIDIGSEDVLEDVKYTGKKARLWGKTYIERDSNVLGDTDPSSVLPADFIIPYENNYAKAPPNTRIELRQLILEGCQPPPPSKSGRLGLDIPNAKDLVHHALKEIKKIEESDSDTQKVQVIPTYPASISFSVTTENKGTEEYEIRLSKDVYFVTAHPCAPSKHVKYVRAPSSPSIQKIDVSGHDMGGKLASTAAVTGHPLHKFYSYTVMHLTDLLEKRNDSIDDLIQMASSLREPSLVSSRKSTPRVLVVDCFTGFAEQEKTFATPTSPILDTASSETSSSAGGIYMESRRRQFGSDVEVLARAICAERGWNALISRRRRGCLSCAIREAGALGWKAIFRVE